jgi:hypothetical protein
MIVTELYNGQGLGNQLWCYIVTRVIALDKGYSFGIKSPEKFKGSSFLNLDFGNKVIGGIGPEGGPPRELPQDISYYYAEQKTSHPIDGGDIRTYDPELLKTPDKTKIDGIMQDEQYIKHRKNEISKWLEINAGIECFEYSNDDTCVINFRGGEYIHIKNVFLPKKYWKNAINYMLSINKNFKFIVVTDDVVTARKFFPNYKIVHTSIATDYSIIKNAHYLILSNSSFAWFPAWLSETLKVCLAPKYWARHNINDGFWGCGYNVTSGWLYLDRAGKVFNYKNCIQEINKKTREHPELYRQQKVQSNFLVLSNYYNDLSWVPHYSDNYIIYDQSEARIYPALLNTKKVTRSPHLGHNIRDYCSYIVDNYDKLPPVIIFATGNIFPRHISKERFNYLVNNQYFTPLEQSSRYAENWPWCTVSSDGGFLELNNNWYLADGSTHPTKYFHTYNDFLKFIFEEPVLPRYIRFAPGANYIVARGQIVKYPKIFYKNLIQFVSHSKASIPGESHIIERALFTIWSSNFKLSERILKPISINFVPAVRTPSSQLRRFASSVVGIALHINNIRQRAFAALQYKLNYNDEDYD